MRFIVERADRLDVFLAQQMPDHSRTRLAKLIGNGEVTVDGQIRPARFKVAPGAVVELETPEAPAPHDLTPADIPVPILYEDDDLLVINKPRHLAVHPAASLKEPSLVNALLHRGSALSQVGEAYRPGIVHRLDKETTGLLVVAKHDVAHVRLAKQIEAKTADRRYFAVTGGRHDQSEFVIDAPIGRDPANRQRMAVVAKGKRAVTHVREVARLDVGMLVAVRLETGRTHQIRVHLLAVGCPVLGDKLYAPKHLHEFPLQLHAAQLAFDHPSTSERMTFYAEPPSDFLGREWATQEALGSAN